MAKKTEKGIQITNNPRYAYMLILCILQGNMLQTKQLETIIIENIRT